MLNQAHRASVLLRELRPIPFLILFVHLFVGCATPEPDQDDNRQTATQPAAVSASPCCHYRHGNRTRFGDRANARFCRQRPGAGVSGRARLAELRSKIVLLDFRAYGWINCLHVIPELKRLEAKVARELEVIGVHDCESPISPSPVPPDIGHQDVNHQDQAQRGRQKKEEHRQPRIAEDLSLIHISEPTRPY
mgnify:CR=1 FL=1